MPETRGDLPPLERAVSDTLDEWLIRMHGITSSHSHPREFLAWLRDNGHEVVATGELAALRDEVEQLRVAVNPRKADAVKSLVSSTTRLVRIERDDARAALARVKGLHSEIPYKPGFCYCANPYPCPTIRALDGAGAVSEEQTEPLRHLGGNAEDCPACAGTNLPYPFLCPGEEQNGGGDA